MKAHAEQPRIKGSRSRATDPVQRQSASGSPVSVRLNRPDAVAQRRLQEMISGSPRVQQLRSIQAWANAGPIQRMDNGEEQKEDRPALPRYFYHATTKTNAAAIARDGLEPRSVGGEDQPYLCMSSSESGARTLKNRADDVIFRVATSQLDASRWSKRGAGKGEWRSFEGIPGALMEYRRNLGTTQQKAWKPASDYQPM